MSKFDAALQTTTKIAKARPMKAGKPARGKGARGGKYADPAYTQVSGYIKKDTLRAVKVGLINHGDGKDFSELLEELLASWAQSVDR